MATGFTVMEAMGERSKAAANDTPKARFRTKDISISKMYRNEMNFYSLEDIEELAGEILMLGLTQNLEVVYEPTDKGEYRIIAGERRWLALKMLVEKGYKEFETATCKITVPKNADEEQIEIIIANAYRDKKITDIIEEEKRLKAALENMKRQKKQIKGYDLQSGRLRDVIAGMLRVSKTKVAQIEAVNNNLIPEFWEELKNERLTFSAAYEVSGLPEEKQKEMWEQYQQTGELTHKEVKEAKETPEQSAAVEPEETEQERTEAERQERPGQQLESVSESDTEYQTPHPEGITSLCYSCTEYETCNVKTGTCTSCDQYRNRTEAYKTEEQRYNEEQDAIDRQTQKKLREMAEAEKMENLPSDTEKNKQKTSIDLSIAEYERIYARHEQTYIIIQSTYNVRTGDVIELVERVAGKETGRKGKMKITSMDTPQTSSALVDGYDIASVQPIERLITEGKNKNEAIISYANAVLAEIAECARQEDAPVYEGDKEIDQWVRLSDVEKAINSEYFGE